MENAASPASSPGAGPSSLRPPPQAAALPEELVEEILLRFPPDEPASLFRAALVCKPWCSLISGPGFRRRFRKQHRTPSMLGFLCSTTHEGSSFVPTAAFCPPGTGRFDWKALGAHHGRVVDRRYVPEEGEETLIVWDPIISWAAAVLCAATAAGTGVCHHLDCHRGPFVVVFVGFDPWVYPYEMFIYTFSSDVDTWSEPISTQHLANAFVCFEEHNVLVGNALYFGFHFRNITVKYNLESREISWIELPSECSSCRHLVHTTMEEGVLGLVTVSDSKLSMWLRKDAPEVDARWTKITVIDLETLLPLDGFFTLPHVVGFADGPGILFMMVGSVLYTIDLKTRKVELCQQKHKGDFCIVPYMSFYTPDTCLLTFCFTISRTNKELVTNTAR